MKSNQKHEVIFVDLKSVLYTHTMIHRKIASFLKHTFIPHEGNEYKPHFFREHVILSILIGSVLLLLVSFTSYVVIRSTTFGSSVVSSVLIDLTNQTRTQNGLSPLANNQQLHSAALLKGEDMSERNYFSHFAPDGTTPWHWFAKAGYTFLFAGENLAINFRSSDEVTRAWMASPKHRENILDPRYEDIGIATIPAVSNDKKVLFVVQLFGKPEKHATSQPPVTTPDSLSPSSTFQPAAFYEKSIFNASYYIHKLYMLLAGILIVALLMMIFIEIRKQHFFHILYGVLLIIVVIICSAINVLLL